MMNFLPFSGSDTGDTDVETSSPVEITDVEMGVVESVDQQGNDPPSGTKGLVRIVFVGAQHMRGSRHFRRRTTRTCEAWAAEIDKDAETFANALCIMSIKEY